MTTLLTEKEVCERFKISRGAVARHFGYARYKIGRIVRYDLEAIERHSAVEARLLAAVESEVKGEKE